MVVIGELKFLGKFTKKKIGGGGVGGGLGRGGGRVGVGVRVDVNEELKFGGGVGRGGGQVGVGLVGGQGGCERNVRGRGDLGYGGCEPRMEGIVQCTKKYCTIIRK